MISAALEPVTATHTAIATATDADGFSATRTQTLRVRDPLDSRAPVLAWAGALLSDLASDLAGCRRRCKSAVICR